MATIERLEDRTLLSSVPANVFANFSGNVSEAGEQDTVPIHITPGNFTIDGGHVTLGVEIIPTEGSSLVPNAVEIESFDPGKVPTIFETTGLEGGGSLVLGKFKHGDFNLHVTAAGASTGEWTMRVFLVGDVNGDFSVDIADIDMLKAAKQGNPSAEFLAVGDSNRDGRITGYDQARAQNNNGVSTSVRVLTIGVGLDPASETGLPGDNLVNQTPIDVIGVTLEGANVSLDEDGDGFDDGTTIATALVGTTNYSLSANLVSGPNFLGVEARDSFGQIAHAEILVTLDDGSPRVVSTTPGEGVEVEPESGQNIPVEIVFSEPMIGSSVLEALSVSGDITGTVTPLNPSYDDATNTLSFELSASLTDTNITVNVAGNATDLAGNNLSGGAFALNFEVSRVPRITSISPANGTERVSLTREVMVRFSSPIDPASITDQSLKIIALGEDVSGRRVVSSTERFVTFFPDQPWNASTEVRIQIDGDLIIGRNGEALDADGDGVAGGLRTADFRTLSITRIPGTNVFGFVRDSFTGEPIVGATIRVDAFPEANVITDANGRFELMNMPAPEFFVHIDGSTATNAPAGFAYPNVGKPFHSVPGQTVQLEMNGQPFDIFLPPMAISDIQTLSTTEPTNVGFGDVGMSKLVEMFPEVDPTMFDLMRVTFQPGSAVDEFGNAATEASIIPVPPDRIPGPLPPNLNPQLVISIQAGGATNFDVPAEVAFPNLEGLAPGEQTLIFSFDHDAGQFVVVGTGTVTQDGLSIVSDPGFGILAPGWHFTQVGTDTAGDPCEPGTPCVRVFGERGDIIRIDLTGTGGTNFRVNTGSFNGGAVAVDGSMVISEGGDVAETGIFYVVPEITNRPQTTAATGPNVIEGTFTADIEVTENGVTRTKTETAIVRIEVMPNYTAFALTGSVGEGGDDEPLDVYRVQQRLKYLGFPDRNGGQLTVDGTDDAATNQAIRLFQAAIHPDQLSPGDLGDPGNDGNPLDTSDGTVDVGLRTSQWLNAANAPRYVELIDSGNDFDIFRGQNQTERWGTSWAVETIYNATAAVTGIQIITAISEDGYTALHAEHKSGLDIDVNIAGPGRTPGTGPNLTAGEQQVVDEMVAFFNNATVPVARMIVGFQRIADEVNRVVGTDIVVVDPGTTHDNHFHVDLEPPGLQALPNTARFASSSLIAAAISTAPGFGDDDRIFYRFDLANGLEISGRTNSAGAFSEILTPNVDYTVSFYRASDNRTGVYQGTSNASGQPTDLGVIILDQFGGPDADGDGIPDVGERAIGTSATLADTDGDGISDDAELEQGLNPLDDRGFPTGIISSLPLPGSATEIVVEESTAYIATGSHGLAVVDVSRFNDPILLGQLDLPGTATDVDVDPALGLAVVTMGTSGVQIIDVSDPMTPAIQHVTTNVLGTRVEVVDGVAYVAVGGSLTSIDVATGDILETLNLGGSITDIAQEGSFLYTMNTSRQLRVVDITGGEMVARGSVFLPDGGGKLFVGNGIAYAAAANTSAGGFATADVTNPDAPMVISGTDAPVESAPGTAIVSNGSGIGLLIGQSQRVTGDPSSLQLVNVSDPANTYNLLAQINLPAPPSSIAIASGIAFVANGSSGLQVINYLPFDNQGQAPTVTISTSAIDVDPLSDGVQVVEGTSIPIQANVTDDVQVRNVELIVNGVVVGNDVSFPFDFSAIALSDDPNAPITTVQVRATDTGGNVALSNILVLDLIPDTFPPEIVSVDPNDGATKFEGYRTIRLQFSESIVASPDAFEIIEAGLSGVFGDGDDVAVEIVSFQLRSNDMTVQLTTDLLSVGVYELRVHQDAITDRAGNPLGVGSLVNQFVVEEFTGPFIKTNNTTGIVDRSTANRSVEFSLEDLGGNDTVTDVNVTIDFMKHDGQTFGVDNGGFAFNSEIVFGLQSPSGTFVQFIPAFTYTGGTPGGRVVVTYDDEAEILAGGHPIAGRFKPAQPLSAFDGESGVGQWTVSISDTVGADALSFWSVSVELNSRDDLGFFAADQPASPSGAGTDEISLFTDGQTENAVVEESLTTVAPHDTDVGSPFAHSALLATDSIQLGAPDDSDVTSEVLGRQFLDSVLVLPALKTDENIALGQPEGELDSVIDRGARLDALDDFFATAELLDDLLTDAVTNE